MRFHGIRHMPHGTLRRGTALALTVALQFSHLNVAHADNCNALADSIRQLEGGGDARDGELIRQLHAIHYKTCVVDPTTPAPKEDWYNRQGQKLPTPSDGSPPPDAAYMTIDATAKKCASNPSPSVCALMVDAERGRKAREARKNTPIGKALPGGGLAALSSPQCTALLQSLARSAKGNDSAGARGAYARLDSECSDVLVAAAKESNSQLPTRAMGTRSRNLFGPAVAGRSGGDGAPASADWDVADVLRFGLGIASVASQLKAATAPLPPAGDTRLKLSSCLKLRNMASTCRQNQANMGLPGQSAGGTAGQAGAFNDCAKTYQAAYNAACR